MAKFPSLPLFTDAYLADTRHLTTIQHGAYMLMLMTAWRSPDCSLPNDDAYLAKICGMDKRTWAKNKDAILQFWEVSDAKMFQKRLRAEQRYVAQVSRKNSDAGKASALKRKETQSTVVQPDGNENPTPRPIPISFTKVKDAKALFWDTCKAYLGENKSSLVGKWVKEYGLGAVFEAVSQAQAANPAEPITYIAAILQKNKPKGEKPKGNVTVLGVKNV